MLNKYLRVLSENAPLLVTTSLEKVRGHLSTNCDTSHLANSIFHPKNSRKIILSFSPRLEAAAAAVIYQFFIFECHPHVEWHKFTQFTFNLLRIDDITSSSEELEKQYPHSLPHNIMTVYQFNSICICFSSIVCQ